MIRARIDLPLHDVRQRRPPCALGERGDGRKLHFTDEQIPAGGARRDRTDDLLLAKQALSQLSYGPCRDQISEVGNQENHEVALFLIIGSDH